MDSMSDVLLGFVVAFALLPAAFISSALGTPVVSGLLGYFVARRVSDNCTVCAGATALFAVCVPLVTYGIAKACLSEQSLIQNILASSAFLLKLPTYAFDGKYDQQTYGGLALAASAALLFLIVWLVAALLCRMQGR